MLVYKPNQFVDVGPAIGVEEQANFFGLVAQDEAEEFAGFGEVCHFGVLRFENDFLAVNLFILASLSKKRISDRMNKIYRIGERETIAALSGRPMCGCVYGAIAYRSLLKTLP